MKLMLSVLDFGSSLMRKLKLSNTAMNRQLFGTAESLSN